MDLARPLQPITRIWAYDGIWVHQVLPQHRRAHGPENTCAISSPQLLIGPSDSGLRYLADAFNLIKIRHGDVSSYCAPPHGIRGGPTVRRIRLAQASARAFLQRRRTTRQESITATGHGNTTAQPTSVAQEGHEPCLRYHSSSEEEEEEEQEDRGGGGGPEEEEEQDENKEKERTEMCRVRI